MTKNMLEAILDGDVSWSEITRPFTEEELAKIRSDAKDLLGRTLTPEQIRDAERLRDIVKRTWNPPLFGAAGYATVAQTAVMQTLAIVFGKEFLGTMTAPQERTIDLGLALLGEVLHRPVALQTWVIEYEIPPLRAIYIGEVNCETEEQARAVFSLERPGYRIRSVRKREGGAV